MDCLPDPHAILPFCLNGVVFGKHATVDCSRLWWHMENPARPTDAQDQSGLGRSQLSYFCMVSSFMYDKLMQGGTFDFDGVKRWSAEGKHKHQPRFFPVRGPSGFVQCPTERHWLLAAVQMHERRVRILDSMLRVRNDWDRCNEVGSNVAAWVREGYK